MTFSLDLEMNYTRSIGGEIIMAHSSSNSNYKVVPEATEALNKFKYEVASDVAVKNTF